MHLSLELVFHLFVVESLEESILSTICTLCTILQLISTIYIVWELDLFLFL